MIKLVDYNTLHFLNTEEDMAAYLKAAKKEGDTDYFLRAASNVMTARALLQLARDTGIDYEKLCDTFSHDASPSQQIINKIDKALAVPLHA